MSKRALHPGIMIAFAVLAAMLAGLLAGQSKSETVRVGNADIGGVVSSPKGPEAGVWVIAETSDLPTKFVKIVVTDDQGRYLVPELPKANYSVFVRGYGLVDSPKVKATPGQTLNLNAGAAPDKKAAAEYYPVRYWYSLVQVPPKSDFPGTGPSGNGIATSIKSQGQWIREIVNTDGCTGCHQMGDKATREIPDSILHHSKDSSAAWERRIQSGQAGAGMAARFNQVGSKRAAAMYADWTDRIAKGEVPSAAPSRPQGKERDVVVTMWDWADPKVYLHDDISSDKRNPTVNANGPIYGALEESGDYLTAVDPTHTATSQIKLIVRDPGTPSSGDTPPMAPSPFWGDEKIWNSQTTVHSFAMDKQGRVWAAARVRKPETSAFCQAGSDHPSAKLLPIPQGQRGLELYDPKTKQLTAIDTCYTWGHVNFDDNDVLWSSFGPGGVHVDSKGVVWTVLSSGHYASFDRSKCKGPLNGPTAATGQHCPEGWTLYPFPGPNYKGAVENGSADSAYYNFVDRFDTLGAGKDVPLATGNLSEGLLVLDGGKFLTLRVPYPMGYYAKGLDGRIDNPNSGWKGKGLYTPISTRAPFHMEGGKGTTAKLVKFQMRPDPLAN